MRSDRFARRKRTRQAAGRTRAQHLVLTMTTMTRTPKSFVTTPHLVNNRRVSSFFIYDMNVFVSSGNLVFGIRPSRAHSSHIFPKHFFSVLFLVSVSFQFESCISVTNKTTQTKTAPRLAWKSAEACAAKSDIFTFDKGQTTKNSWKEKNEDD